MENDKRFTLAKINVILIAVGFAIIILGFIFDDRFRYRERI